MISFKLFLQLLILLLTFPINIYSQTWTTGAPLPVVQSEWHGVSIGTNFYIVGGEMKRTPTTDNTKPADELWIYDTQKDEWSQGPNMPAGRNHVAVTTLDGYVYVFGGYGFACCDNYPWPEGTSNAWRWKPGDTQWENLAPVPRRFGAGMAEAFNGKIYIFAGTTDGPFQSVADVHEYDPVTNSWLKKTSMKNRREHVRGVVIDSLIYVIGGHYIPNGQAQRENQGSVEAYSPASDTWYDKGQMSFPRGGIGVGYLGGKIYVFGGETATFGALNRVDAYDVITGNWEQVSSTPGGSIHGQAAITYNGKSHIIGGSSPQGFQPKDWHNIFTPEQVQGCTDPQATNFDIYATVDDNSCILSIYINEIDNHIKIKKELHHIQVSGMGLRKKSLKVISLDGKLFFQMEFNSESFSFKKPNQKGVYLIQLKSQSGIFNSPLVIF